MLALRLVVGVATGTRGLVTVRHDVECRLVHCVVVDGDVGVRGSSGICKRSVRGFFCHQALVCVRLVSEYDSFALLKTVYPMTERVLTRIGRPVSLE